MGKAKLLKIGDKEVLSTKITYDDLIVLYQQYVATYGEIPTSIVSDHAHNLPNRKTINNILKEQNIEYCDFIKQFNVKTKRIIKIENQVDAYKQMFPIMIQNITYNLFGNIDIIHKKSNHNAYYLNLIDNEGYRYNCTFKTVMAAKKINKPLNRFFKRNSYTYENINLYCKLHNIALKLDDYSNLPVSNYARENLPFIDNNGNLVVISWNDVQRRNLKDRTDDEMIKIENKVYMSKECASDIIVKKYKELQRPLLQSDFEGIKTTKDSVGIRIIWRIWGNFSNMIKDLELPEHDSYYRPNNKYYKSHEEIMSSIKYACDMVLNENRTIITSVDLEKYTGLNMNRIRNHCKLDNVDFKQLLKNYGCEMQPAGNGMNYIFSDSEKVVSKFEYDFSLFLRKHGLNYNVDYFRDIPYKTLDKSYTGNMNCDYLLILNNHKIYIELAGILGNKNHQEAYRNNIHINSKSKETYRLKLYQKREIFERNHLEYYILLPDEMNENTYNDILNKYLKEAA
ncbi:MAG: hypothetical protein KHY19_14075 [Coprobacillus cateniformis]|nr:hypothetical protein [Coprobacillus cateniformis]